jgi:hypothetical protein
MRPRSVVGCAPGPSGGGGGPAEKNIVFAYANLERYIEICLSSALCNLNKGEKYLLEKIKANYAKEGNANSIIQFRSEKLNKGFFIEDGNERVAVTGSKVGEPIYFNLDLIYKKNKQGDTVPLSLEDAIAHLIHELGHHQGEKDHTQLDLLGAKVQIQLGEDAEIYTIRKAYRTKIIVYPSVAGLNPQFILKSQEVVTDLTPFIEKKLTCDSSYLKPWSNVPKDSEDFTPKSFSLIYSEYLGPSDSSYASGIKIRCESPDKSTVFTGASNLYINFTLEEHNKLYYVKGIDVSMFAGY